MANGSIGPGIIYFGERAYREYRARRSTRLSKVLVHPSGKCLVSDILVVISSFDCMQVQWSCVSSSPASSTPQVNGFSSKSLKSLTSSGTRFVLALLGPLPLLICFQFTITSAPKDPYVSIHIRQVGDFTRALGDRLGVGPSVVAAMTSAAMKGSEKNEKTGSARGDFVELDAKGGVSLPAVRIDGPYGAPAEDVFDVEVAILVGAGIGK